MKLLRFGQLGHEKPGVIDANGEIRDCSAYMSDIDPQSLETFDFKQFENVDFFTLPSVDPKTRLGVCVNHIGKIICIGFNSKQHAAEVGIKRSSSAEPLVFMKPISSLAGPNDPILFARHTQKLDWEAELAVVIGKQGKYLTTEQAADHIFGYACFNDLSERYLQFETEDKQFTKGKCFDGAARLGPYLVPKSAISDSHDLQIKLWVNDDLRQDFNSGDYVRNEMQIISYVSQYFTLYPGDVISMGSAPGSASAWGEDYFLRPGDNVKMEIAHLGVQEQVVVKEP
ncbi:MAG: fumarylacetoacetate hydrolase family protein [Gammaproteobacteria bacterium]|nr:fumarylacetoacetate hydrolase family protein [Gammaproteobacteria bacterium]